MFRILLQNISLQRVIKFILIYILKINYKNKNKIILKVLLNEISDFKEKLYKSISYNNLLLKV